MAGILETYAQRGVFRGFSRGPVRGGRAHFKVLWHRDQLFEIVLDLNRSTIGFSSVLPQVPGRSAMYREFREYVASRQSDSLPDHRRIDPAKAAAKCSNRAGDATVSLAVVGGDYGYAVRKLIHLVHEIYLDFLVDGRYYDYLVETFNLDPDHM